MHDDLSSDEFRGFHEAERLMNNHRSRARVRERLSCTGFFSDDEVAAVHVENIPRADRALLSAFDRAGRQLRGYTLYVDDPSLRLDVVPEFDHDYTAMAVVEGSDLEEAVSREDGWVVDMNALREYDIVEDRRTTQRAVFLAHLGDMMNDGRARGFVLGRVGDSESSS
ncbi:hypothetical protein ARTSIC4J27_1980 [Pseudarthrobacter siccitolerans]|uniref:Uncharacterized protein n=1 Tax=Pseudarthrobacter siccitolerans TaxID=861266 RepID=A0A024H1I2_9MICC|nr:hypothetical protein [Pseudarthrobacter siccitolerans]CCQ46020.1 hypothetical protein ARTSIC4J27_1980 [Pseudarthrobacter siccitolerans]